MRVSLVLYIMYCISPYDKDLYMDILTENGLAESSSGTTDACLISLIIEPLHEISNYVVWRPAKPQISLRIRAV